MELEEKCFATGVARFFISREGDLKIKFAVYSSLFPYSKTLGNCSLVSTDFRLFMCNFFLKNLDFQYNLYTNRYLVFLTRVWPTTYTCITV